MTFTAPLPAGVDFPEETWLPAIVRRHGSTLDITADDSAACATENPATIKERREALEKWLASSAAQPVCQWDDAAVADLRWQGLKAKYKL